MKETRICDNALISLIILIIMSGIAAIVFFNLMSTLRIHESAFENNYEQVQKEDSQYLMWVKSENK